MADLNEIQTLGEVFTRRWVVDVLLDLTDYTIERDLGSLRFLEPSCGSGAFLGPAVERLIASAIARGHELSSLQTAIRAYDVQPEYVASSRALCRNLLSAAGATTRVAANLARTWVQPADFLLLPAATESCYDVVVGNPPYIRYDDLPTELAAKYRRLWPTMRGRGDIYVGFIERALRMLAPEGKVGFICADRWMRNQYGAELRSLVCQQFAVEHVWSMHDVDAFENQVSAYPAITVLANQPQGTAVVAETNGKFDQEQASTLVKAISDDAFHAFDDIGVTAHRLPGWFAGGSFWPTGSPARLALIEHLNERFPALEDPSVGTKVSIGIATGADNVYVTKDRSVAEPDRMLPISMRRDLMSGSFDWQGNYLVNPWRDDGRLVDLSDYPRLASYLERHPTLKDRFVARKSPTSWHRTIDKVNASIIDKPKLLLQDMKAHIHPVFEPGGYYPHHNLYYIVSDAWDLEVLGGLLLSRIAQAFIEAYCVRMRGGTLRFQAQYLKQIRVPAPDTVSKAASDDLREAFRARDVDAATEAAAKVYEIDLAEYELTDSVRQ
ncbi:DNA methylase [Mycobacteroides abscessus subsp. abscessus]|uniref:Eco57I restriction-modification methylase domain-containing protein n=1 Tax=Mycobacteroides abscessus TaxID=36809 RepID=UPI00092A8794|nr:Eco57I restriction-modification methylase domain-containing protein [Mycobacteroides abscessus]SID09568.1 DNA methylase [Mycobacteroides abscessus subsp. abscessus]SKU77167.1 DNA methylase [Mycobacteroides abscessus subsp. abscessus]